MLAFCAVIIACTPSAIGFVGAVFTVFPTVAFPIAGNTLTVITGEIVVFAIYDAGSAVFRTRVAIFRIIADAVAAAFYATTRNRSAGS